MADAYLLDEPVQRSMTCEDDGESDISQLPTCTLISAFIHEVYSNLDHERGHSNQEAPHVRI